MNKNKPGNPDLPDFDALSDRLIAQATDSPSLVIKTNLDPKDVSEENPYMEKGTNEKANKELQQYFDPGE